MIEPLKSLAGDYGSPTNVKGLSQISSFKILPGYQRRAIPLAKKAHLAEVNGAENRTLCGVRLFVPVLARANACNDVSKRRHAN